MSDARLRFDERANQLYVQQRFEDLKELSRKMLADDPEYAYAQVMYGMSLCSLGDRNGFEIMESALRLEPQNDYYHYLIAYERLGFGEYEMALEFIASALEINPLNERHHSFKAEVYFNMGDYETAIGHADKALEINPNYATAYSIKSRCYADLGNFAEAEKCLERAFQIDPDRQQTKYNASVVYRLQKKFDRSKETLRDFLGKDPRSRAAKAAYVISHQGKFFAVFFTPRVGRIMEKIAMTFAVLCIVLQILAIKHKDLTVYATVANYITYVLMFYFYVYSFTPLVLVLKLKPIERNSIVQRSNIELMFAYTGLMLIALAMLTDLIFRNGITHFIYFTALHLFAYVWWFNRTLLADKRPHQYAVAYMFGGIFALIWLSSYDFIKVSSIMAPFAVGLAIMSRMFFIQVTKVLLGFKEDPKK